MTRTAVVLMNLGGPDSPAAVAPFLYNLFSDPAIIGLPGILRRPLARLIAARRASVAQGIYERMGGASPLLANTQAQACALEQTLGPETRVFVAMRYWHPLTEETVREVRDWQAEEVVLLPLYPQFSTTTTASSLAAWRKAAARAGFECPTRIVRSYPAEPRFIAAQAQRIAPALDEAAAAGGAVRLVFTAHGLPQRIVRRGDPYPREVKATAAAILAALDRPGLDWRISYQSRVGPLEWLGPYTDDEIRAAGAAGTGLVVAPISFVSEHSETLVELDDDYARLARECGVPSYRRVATVGTHPLFIAALAALVRRAQAGERG
jgi:protoporphyrin/coproporphyrin ferrochelatase